MAHPEFIQQGLDKRLSHVIEECGEVLAMAGKIQRFGMHNVNPLLPKEQQEPNISRLISELGDLKEAIHRFETTLIDQVLL